MTDTEPAVTAPIFTQPFTCYTNPHTGINGFLWACLECGGELGYYGDNIDGARAMFAKYAPRHETHGAPEIQRRLDYLVERAANVLMDTHAHVNGLVPFVAAGMARTQAEDIARAGMLAGVSPMHEWAFEEVGLDRYGVHAGHCCVRHGCKYHYRFGPNCPVVTKRVKQEQPCAHCEDDATDLAIDTARGK